MPSDATNEPRTYLPKSSPFSNEARWVLNTRAFARSRFRAKRHLREMGAVRRGERASCSCARLGRLRSSSSAATLLVFPLAAAGAGIITADLHRVSQGRSRVEELLNVRNVFRFVWFHSDNDFPIISITNGENLLSPSRRLHTNNGGIV